MEPKYHTIQNGADLLAFLQTLSPEELALPIARTDNESADYGPFYDEVSMVAVNAIPLEGWRNKYSWCIIF